MITAMEITSWDGGTHSLHSQRGRKVDIPTVQRHQVSTANHPGDFQTNFYTGDNFKACPVKANIKPTSARK